MWYSGWIGRHRAKNAWSGKFIGEASTYKRCYNDNLTIFVTEDTRCYQVLVIRPDVVSIQARLWADKWVYIGLTSGLYRAYIGSKSGKKYISGLYLLAFVSTSLNKRALPYVFPWDVVCLSGVFRVCEVADEKTIKHDKPRNINEYSRCTPGKIPKDLRSLAFSSRYYPINPYNRFTPDIPKINKHVCSFRAVCRCWPNIGPSLPMSEDVPGKSNVVYRCTLAICGCTYETCRFSHRGPSDPTIGTV